MANPGDHVEIICSDEIIEGTLMPSPDEDITVVKLKSGYNKGISKLRVKSLKVLEKYQLKENPTKLNIKDSVDAINIKSVSNTINQISQKLPIISILHTGGTIASKVDYKTGGVVARFSPDEFLTLVPELKTMCVIRSRLLANMWSDDMRFSHYAVLADAIQNEIEQGCEGIIITQGTDTLHYTAAALAFICESLPIPVLIVGAQRSSDRGSSDAQTNVIAAVTFMTKTDFAGLGICMHAGSSDTLCNILPATKCRKMHSSTRHAFKAINTIPIASINLESKDVIFNTEKYMRRGSPMIIKPAMEDKVAIIKVHSNMHSVVWDVFSKQKFKGLIIEGTGLGHAPTGAPNEWAKPNLKILKSLRKLIAQGCVVVMTTQTIFGRLNMNIYSRGRELQEEGVIPGNDMDAETAFVKLAWLLANYSVDDTKQLMTENLRGEIAERSIDELKNCSDAIKN